MSFPPESFFASAPFTGNRAENLCSKGRVSLEEAILHVIADVLVLF